MQNMKLDGIATIEGGEYGNVIIDGIGKCAGDLKAERLSIDGVFQSTGSVAAKTFECDGVATVKGDIFAGNLEVDGVLTLSKGTKLEATTILCDGVIKMSGQISADRIEADGVIKAREIVGDSILIESHRHFFWFFSRRGSSRSRIDLIEATTVSLIGVTAESVNGKDVTIGRGCRIEHVDCSGTLYISPYAHVGNVTGTYTPRDR